MAKNPFITDTPLSHTDLIAMHNDVIPIFYPHWTNGNRNERMLRAKNWNYKEEAAHAKTGRIPYSFPLVAQKINTIIATQSNARTSWKAEAFQDPEDEIKATLATVELRDLERRSQFPYIETDIFRSGIGVDYGVAELVLEKDENLNTIVNVKPRDYRLCVWDRNSRDYLLDDALFAATRNLLYRQEIEEHYGEEVAKIVPRGDYFQNLDRTMWDYYVGERRDTGLPYDVITLVHHYQKVVRDYYAVIFDDVMNLHGMHGKTVVGKYKSRQAANTAIRKFQMPYALLYGMDRQGEIVPTQIQALDRYDFTFAGIVDYEQTDLEEFPVLPYRSFHFQDEWWTLADMLRDPQVFFDRTMSQIDFSMGTDVKNAYAVDKNSLDGITWQQAEDRLTQSGGVIPIKQRANGAKVIEPIQRAGVNPQYFELLSIMQSTIEDLAGGRSFQGLGEKGGDESGKAIQLKALQGQLIAYLLVDNLERWKKKLGSNALDWMGKFQNQERLVKIMGTSLTDQSKKMLQEYGLYTRSQTEPWNGYATLNKDGVEQSFLKDAKLEITITEAMLAESDRDAKLSQIEKIQNITQQPAPLAIVLKYAGIDPSLQQEWLDSMKDAEEMAQKNADAELRQKQAKAKADLMKGQAALIRSAK